MADALPGALIHLRPCNRRINFSLLSMLLPGALASVGSLQAISHTSKNPAAAMAFLELFNTDKYLNNLINYGIEGSHYVNVSDNVVKAGPAADEYNLGMQWMFGNQFLNYLYANEDPVATYKAVGIDTIMAEVQKQYDAWRAKKK